MTDRPTGPALADAVAARMPGWKRHGPAVGGGTMWAMPNGKGRVTGCRSDKHDPLYFWPDCDIADATEAIFSLNDEWSIDYKRGPHTSIMVWIFVEDDYICGACALSKTNGDKSRAICLAICRAVEQLPEAAKEKTDAD